MKVHKVKGYPHDVRYEFEKRSHIQVSNKKKVKKLKTLQLKNLAISLKVHCRSQTPSPIFFFNELEIG